jgi:hypothetical protein
MFRRFIDLVAHTIFAGSVLVFDGKALRKALTFDTAVH